MHEENQQKQTSGFLGRVFSLPNDSITKTIVMTVLVCLVCAVLVATAAVALKEKQINNKLVDKQKNILQVAGLDDVSLSVEERFKHIEPKIVDLATGDYVDDVDVAAFDQRLAARDPQQSSVLTKQQDIAGISRRAHFAKVYLVKGENDSVSKIILPVHGYGLWSTLYGFVSLQTDESTIYRIKFYDHLETPGLGGEVDNPKWLAIWNGKQFFNESGDYALSLIKGSVNPASPKAAHQIDGLAGATLTSRGVDNLFKFWLSDQGFGPYLYKLRAANG